jgi:membrane protein YdbS with pleckstrin-like domain
MIYEPFKRTLLRLLKAPTEAPEPPAGSHASVAVFRASPRYLSYRLLGVTILAAFLALIWLVLAIVILASGEPLVLLVLLPLGAVLALVVALRYVGTRIDYDMRYYVVTDRSIRIREGAFVIREKTLTHANVQNLNVVQGPLMRMFGIKSLAVDTAGGGGQAAEGKRTVNQHRFEIAGVENAAEVRDLVLSYLRLRGKDGGLGDPDDAAARGPAAGAATIGALREVHAAAGRLRRAAEATV